MEIFSKILLIIVGLVVIGSYPITSKKHKYLETQNHPIVPNLFSKDHHEIDITKEQTDKLSSLVTTVCIEIDGNYLFVKSLVRDKDKLRWLKDNLTKIPTDRLLHVYQMLTEAYPSNDRYTRGYIYYEALRDIKIEKEAQRSKSVPAMYIKRCQLNGGAYIAHSKANITEAWKYVYIGKWSMLKTMTSQGKLRKVGEGPYNIEMMEANDKYVKFSISIAPGKEIWTLTIFTQGCR